MKYAIFEEKYNHEQQSRKMFTKLQIVEIVDSLKFQYPNGKIYGLNTEITSGQKVLGRKLNTHFIDTREFDKKIEGEKYVLNPASIIYFDNENLLQQYLTQNEVEQSKKDFPFMFNDAAASEEELQKCQDFLNKVAEKGYKPSENVEDDDFTVILGPQFGYTIDFSKNDREK